MALYMRYKQQRLMSLAQRVRESFPTSFDPEASPTDLLTEVHKSKLLSPGDGGPLELAQTGSSQKIRQAKRGVKKSMTKFGDYNRRAENGFSRNIILIIVIFLQTVFCCVMGKVCAPPMAHETKLEHNSRDH